MSKGNSSFLMKKGAKRRRTRAQIEEEKQLEAKLKAEVAAKVAHYDAAMQRGVELEQELAAKSDAFN